MKIKKRRGSRNLKRQRDITRGKGRKRVNIADDENVPGGWKVAHDKKLPNGWKNEVDPPNTHKTQKTNSEEETSSGQSQAKIITEDDKVPEGLKEKSVERLLIDLEVKKEMEIMEDIKEFWEREERKITQKAGKDEVMKERSRRCETSRHIQGLSKWWTRMEKEAEHS